jgi:DNA-binding NtrC family response regulator
VRSSAPAKTEREGSAVDIPADASFRERATRFEASMILEALDATGGNQTEAAKRLGLPLRTLVYKLKTLGIKKAGYTRE